MCIELFVAGALKAIPVIEDSSDSDQDFPDVPIADHTPPPQPIKTSTPVAVDSSDETSAAVYTLTNTPKRKLASDDQEEAPPTLETSYRNLFDDFTPLQLKTATPETFDSGAIYSGAIDSGAKYANGEEEATAAKWSLSLSESDEYSSDITF